MKKSFFIVLFFVLFPTFFMAQNTVTDVDGNVYTTVTIGTQTWMVENLKTTKFNDGTNIISVTNNYEWTELSSGAYCWYSNSSGYKNRYGALYNWYSVASANLCPEGWHVPSDVDWTTLENYLVQQGHSRIIGTVLKSDTFWYNNNNGTDLYGFTAYPAGWRNGYSENVGYFYGMGKYSIFWSATAYQTNQAYARSLYFSSSSLTRRRFSKTDGFSVRCLQNQ